MDERRKSVRLTCRREVLADIGLARLRATVLDFSFRGMLVLAERAVPPGTTVHFRSTEKGLLVPISAWGEARWSRQVCGGVLVGSLLWDGGRSPRLDWVRSLLLQPNRAERRKGFRFPVRLPVRFTLEGVRRTGMVMDLGVGGMCLMTTPDLVPGQRLKLSLCTPDSSRPLLLWAEVRSAGHHLHHLETVQASRGDLNALGSYLVKLMRSLPALSSLDSPREGQASRSNEVPRRDGVDIWPPGTGRGRQEQGQGG